MVSKRQVVGRGCLQPLVYSRRYIIEELDRYCIYGSTSCRWFSIINFWRSQWISSTSKVFVFIFYSMNYNSETPRCKINLPHFSQCLVLSFYLVLFNLFVYLKCTPQTYIQMLDQIKESYFLKKNSINKYLHRYCNISISIYISIYKYK